MKDLPYFLLLVKKNVVLWTIITTGSFTSVNLKTIDHDFWTDQYLQIKDYSLNNNEKFNDIWITLTDVSTIVSFRSTSAKYLEDTKYYFDRDVPVAGRNPYSISDEKVTEMSKKLGAFDIGLEMPVNITVRHSSVYGYSIDLTLYKKGWMNKIDTTKE
jgi:hypothetical protein